MDQAPDRAIILVVDDVSVMRNVVVKGLSACGCKVLDADDGTTALEAVKKQRPHIILLDVMMPRMSGLEFLKKFKADEANNDVDVIMCTAKGERANVIEAIKMGACDYIVKPFKMQVVLDKIFKVLEKRYGARFANLLHAEPKAKAKPPEEAAAPPAAEGAEAEKTGEAPPAPEATAVAETPAAPAGNAAQDTDKKPPDTPTA